MRSNSVWLLLVAFLCGMPARAENANSQSSGTASRPVHKTSMQTIPISQAKLTLPIPDNSLWIRYYQAGEDASLKHHDADLAKKYWMASIAELEKHPPAKGADIFLSVKLSALEAGLMNSYPADWSKQTGDADQIMNQRKEQVDTLLRIARINEHFAPKDDLLRIKSRDRYEVAQKAYDKALEALAASKKSQPKSSMPVGQD